ncbi:MAG: murein biosynthesis integral membrane protein MurJ [Pseudomonadota bacterium]
MLYRAFATVGGLTLVSRVLGFARDILIAAALGTGGVADAFFVAFRFPNLFRRLFGEGAFNAAFVPLYAKRLEGEGAAAASRFAGEALSGLATVIFVLSAVAILAMPWLMFGLAPGFADEPEKFALSVTLSQITFPYLLCMSVVALLSGVLNSHRRYWAAAAAPIVLNVVLITAILIAIQSGYAGAAGAGYVLSIGVTLAGLAQLALLWFAVRRAGIRLSIPRPRWSADMKALVSLGLPGLLAGGITQINIVIGTIIASLQAGAVSYLYYADRLYQLPLGIVGIAVGVVLLPELARSLRGGDLAAAHNSQNRAMEFSLLLTLPAAIGLAALAGPIISVLFERGAFTAADTPATARALQAFALGLPAFVLIKVFQPAYFAREDTRTPMYYAAANLIVNVVLSLALFYAFKAYGLYPHVGIALATSIAGWVNALLLWRGLSRSGAFQWDRRLVSSLAVAGLAMVVMVAVMVGLLGGLAPLFAKGMSLPLRTGALALVIGGACFAYFIVVIAGGALKLSDLRGRRSA